MGLAHLNSFLKNPAKIRYFLVEKIIVILSKFQIFLKKKLIARFQKKIPKKETFDFGVIATRSRERYEICDKLFKNNKVKNLFLEKFLFNDYHHYKLFNKLHKKYKIKTYVNIWSKIFLKE